MRVAIGYCSRDVDQAIRLGAWLKRLGPYPNHNLIVARDASTNERPFADVGFGKVEEILILDDIWKKWPESCNNVFQHVARYNQFHSDPQPFLWLEPDVVPLRAGWLDAIEAEYKACGKPFLGDFVSVHTPELDVPDHMSGVAVYPADMVRNAGLALITSELAWDMAAISQTLPKMAKSSLIHHAWKHPEFKSKDEIWREIFAIKPACVLFHASKDGSLIELLSGENSGAANVTQRDSAEGIQQVSLSVPAGSPLETAAPEPLPAVDIFIKSYQPDFEMLKYCLQSVAIHAEGFRQLVLIVPQGTSDAVKPLTECLTRITPVIIEVVEGGDGYLFQQAIKATSNQFSDAEFFLHIDSDTVLTKPVTPQTFMRNGKALWLMTPYREIEEGLKRALEANPNMDRGIGVMAWQEVAEKFMQEPVEFEFMRRFPMLIPRFVYVGAQVFCMSKHKKRLTDYIMSQPLRHFSEFNALGAFAYQRFRNEIEWLDTSKEEPPEEVLKQAWSWGGMTDEVRQMFEHAINGKNGGDAKCDPATVTLSTEATRTESVSNADTSEAAPSSNPNGAADNEIVEQVRENIRVRKAATQKQIAGLIKARAAKAAKAEKRKRRKAVKA